MLFFPWRNEEEDLLKELQNVSRSFQNYPREDTIEKKGI